MKRFIDKNIEDRKATKAKILAGEETANMKQPTDFSGLFGLMPPRDCNKTLPGAFERLLVRRNPEIAAHLRTVYREAYEKQGDLLAHIRKIVSTGFIDKTILIKQGDLPDHQALIKDVIECYPVIILDGEYNQVSYNSHVAAFTAKATTVVVDSLPDWTVTEEDAKIWKQKWDAMTPEERRLHISDDAVSRSYQFSAIEVISPHHRPEHEINSLPNPVHFGADCSPRAAMFYNEGFRNLLRSPEGVDMLYGDIDTFLQDLIGKKVTTSPNLVLTKSVVFTPDLMRQALLAGALFKIMNEAETGIWYNCVKDHMVSFEAQVYQHLRDILHIFHYPHKDGKVGKTPER